MLVPANFKQSNPHAAIVIGWILFISITYVMLSKSE